MFNSWKNAKLGSVTDLEIVPRYQKRIETTIQVLKLISIFQQFLVDKKSNIYQKTRGSLLKAFKTVMKYFLTFATHDDTKLLQEIEDCNYKNYPYKLGALSTKYSTEECDGQCIDQINQLDNKIVSLTQGMDADEDDEINRIENKKMDIKNIEKHIKNVGNFNLYNPKNQMTALPLTSFASTMVEFYTLIDNILADQTVFKGQSFPRVEQLFLRLKINIQTLAKHHNDKNRSQPNYETSFNTLQGKNPVIFKLYSDLITKDLIQI